MHYVGSWINQNVIEVSRINGDISLHLPAVFLVFNPDHPSQIFALSSFEISSPRVTRENGRYHHRFSSSSLSLSSEKRNQTREMDDSWKRVYRGDTGVPHTDPQQLVATWKGSFTLASIAWLQTHTSNLVKNLQFNWSDKAIKIDQQKWKKVFDKKLKQMT